MQGPATFSQAVPTAVTLAHMPTTYRLGPPQVVLAAAAAGTAVMGVAQPQPELLLLEGLTFGFSVAAVYVVTKTLGDSFRSRRGERARE
jgi:hypothetical protein